MILFYLTSYESHNDNVDNFLKDKNSEQVKTSFQIIGSLGYHIKVLIIKYI